MVPVRSQKLALRNNSPILFEFVQTFTYTYQFKLLKILKYWKFKTKKEKRGFERFINLLYIIRKNITLLDISLSIQYDL